MTTAFTPSESDASSLSVDTVGKHVAQGEGQATMHPQVDRVGVIVSSLCALHCVAGAWLPAAVGALGVGALFGHWAEWGFTLAACLFASAAALMGWRRHRSQLAASLLILGIAGLVASRVAEGLAGHAHDHHGVDWGILLSIGAGVMLIAGHVLNLRASRGHIVTPS